MATELAGRPSLDELVGNVLELLEATRDDVLTLRTSLMLHRSIAEDLSRYDVGGHLVHVWFVHYALITSRRLLGRGRDERSFFQALVRLRDRADELTVEELMRITGLAEGDRRDVERNLGLLVHGDEKATAQQLTMAAVQADLDRLKKADDICAAATSRIAHKLPDPGPAVLIDDIEALADTLLDVYSRWRLTLDAVHVVTDVDYLDRSRPMATALRLFDWEAFVEQHADAERQAAERVGYQNVEVRPPWDEPGVEVRYTFPRLNVERVHRPDGRRGR